MDFITTSLSLRLSTCETVFRTVSFNSLLSAAREADLVLEQGATQAELLDVVSFSTSQGGTRRPRESLLQTLVVATKSPSKSSKLVRLPFLSF